MRVFTKNDSPDDIEEYRKECKEAYLKVIRWEEWEGRYEPEDMFAYYVRSNQSWMDIEDGELLITLHDLQLAKEHYMSIDCGVLGDDIDYFDHEQHRQYAGYSG